MGTQNHGQQSSFSGQSLLLIAILVVLAYIILDIFGIIPDFRKSGKKGGRNHRGGRGKTFGDQLRWLYRYHPAKIFGALAVGAIVAMMLA
jgi:hypothetical protein